MKKTFFLIGLFISVAGFTQDKSQQLAMLFTEAHMKKNFFGNVLIAENGKIIYQQSFGTANYATKEKLNSESVFELASVSKQFTAMGIMLLKKQGKLSYDDSLRKFFPELPYYNITIRQLLHHTSGLPDYIMLFLGTWDDDKIATNKDIIEQLVKLHPRILFKPGEKWEYSNTGYALLASIIEKVSGKSFGAYLDEMIFKPLDMKRTMVFRRRYENKTLPNYAYGYLYDSASKKYLLPDSVAETAVMVRCLDGIVGDGTVNSTTSDLFKWDQALYTEKLVSKEMLAEAFAPGKLNNGEKTKYGFGWGLGENKIQGHFINHSGGWPGYNTLIERDLDSNKTIIILRNHDGPPLPLQKIRDCLYGIKIEPAKEITFPAAVLQQYVGEYELAPGFTITITVEAGKIFAQATGQDKFEIFAEKEDLFFLKIVEAKLQFSKDEKGSVKSLTLFQDGQEIPGPKIK